MRTMRLALATLAFAFVLPAVALAASVPLVTGPIAPSDMIASLNTTINAINLRLSPSGAGYVAASVNVPAVTAAVNQVELAGSATGVAVTVGALGADTNVGIKLVPKGTGVVWFGNAASFTANGSESSTLGSTGVTGHGTVLKWLTVKDSAGTVFYIPVF